LLILNNPHNPTGSFTEKTVIDKFAKGLANFPQVAILSDEIYDRLIFDKKEIPTLFNYPDLYDRLIVLNGWSKTYAMTGWRLGWGVWPIRLIEHVFKFCVNNHSCVNTAAQYGAIAALNGPEDHLNNMMEEFTVRRKLIVDGLRSLKGVDCSLPGGSFFVFPNVKGTGMNGEEPMPIVHIQPKSGFYDYESKYTSGRTEYFCPAELSIEETQRCKDIAVQVYRTLRGNGIPRVDVILDTEGVPYVLEMNTIPGLTPTSLLPMAAKQSGLEFDDLVVEILKLAHLYYEV